MPYSIGLQAATLAFLHAGFPTQFTIAIIAFLLIVYTISFFKDEEPDAPAKLPGSSLAAIHPFFRRRFDFLNWGFHATGTNMFQFQLLRNQVIVTSGEKAREAFFSARGLDLTEGFKILSGALPMLKGVTSDLQSRTRGSIYKRLAAVQRNGSLSDLIPAILEDSRRIMEGWGSFGSFDPFDRVYEVVFQTTVRSLTCSEIADDPVIVARLKVLYDRLDHGTTPATVLLPWFPSPALLKKLWATKEIYEIVTRAIDARERSGVWQNDTLQMLLDAKEERLVIVGFIMGLLIAGARATGTTASWLIMYLGIHQDWRAKAATEVDALLAAYPPPSATEPTPVQAQSLSSQLSHIPLEAWESSLPTLDAMIRETLRVAQPHAAMRRNLGPDMHMDGKRIPTGAYVVYPFADVHLDPEIYADPSKFDPTRPEETKVPFGYVGWGGGKTVCLGTRLAKLELKMVAALFLLGFKHSVQSESGAPPEPNWNDLHMARPPKGSFCVQYERTGVPL
ncbi:hypothetical protein HGRIS_011605 [Hohenbuehelia grisea]|uniref:Cytochrome P450 n=1 Tax=Hohenbuehelia grisea TaxID=104357 RepID=A0ABR3JVS7_9AGAR